MRVVICCNKCEEKVREEISEVYGVEEIFIDPTRSEVVVYGYADKHDVLKKARKMDKRADIMSSDSFTLHHDRHSKHHKHHKNRFSNFFGQSHGHSNYSRGKHMPIFEVTGSPRYNTSLNQSSSYDNRFNRLDGGYDMPDYRSRQTREFRLDYRPDPMYRQMHSGYRSEPETRHRYNGYGSSEYRHEHDHGYEYNGYRPNQRYPPSYVEREDRDSPYPEAVMNPAYIKQMGYY